MSVMFTRLHWPKQTRMRADLSNNANAVRMKLRDLPPPVRLASVLLLLVLLALLVGCATPSVPPSNAASNPQPPQVREPLPSESYLSKAQKLIESWQNAVTGM